MEMTEAQSKVLKICKDEYERKMMTWALDRALEVVKTAGFAKEISGEQLVKEAQSLVDWVMTKPKNFPMPTADEAEAHLARWVETGEIA